MDRELHVLCWQNCPACQGDGWIDHPDEMIELIGGGFAQGKRKCQKCDGLGHQNVYLALEELAALLAPALHIQRPLIEEELRDEAANRRLSEIASNHYEAKREIITLRHELERAQAENREWYMRYDRFLAAEAENAKLRAVLERIASMGDISPDCADVARLAIGMEGNHDAA